MFATYLDARKKLAEHRSARGYYPVVALTDTNALAVASSTSPSHGGKPGKSAKGKRSKSKGKGYGNRKLLRKDLPPNEHETLFHQAPSASDVANQATGPPTAHRIRRPTPRTRELSPPTTWSPRRNLPTSSSPWTSPSSPACRMAEPPVCYVDTMC